MKLKISKTPKQKSWRKGEQICWLNFATENIICHTIHPGNPNGRYIFIGDGHSMDVNKLTDRVTRLEPFAKKPIINGNFSEDTVIGFYYTFNCKGLDVAGQELAEYINSWLNTYNEIILIGHSKAGLCVYNMAKYLRKDLNVKIVTVSAPFDGTAIASRQMFQALNKKPFLNFVQKHIVPECAINDDIVPASAFLRSLPYESMVCSSFEHINYVSVIKPKEEGTKENLQVRFCRFLNKNFFYALWRTPSDGIVTMASQIREYRSENFFQSFLTCTHVESLAKATATVGKKHLQAFWVLL